MRYMTPRYIIPTLDSGTTFLEHLEIHRRTAKASTKETATTDMYKKQVEDLEEELKMFID